MPTMADMVPWNHRGVQRDHVLAIGWLGETNAPAASVPSEFFERLVSLLVNPWQPFIAAGFHACGWCRFSGGPAQLQAFGKRVQMGRDNLFVPAGDRVYVAPSLMAHYIDAHGYAPPEQFQAAVMACPPMGSAEYLAQIERLGPWC